MRLDKPRVAPLSDDQIDPEIREKIGAGPTGTGPTLNIFRTLAHHPGLMKRWLVFGNHVLGKSTLPAREREIAILRIGWLCRSGYEWGQHVVIGKASGLSDDEIARIPQGAAASGWSALERAVLRATDELLRGRVRLGRHLGRARRLALHAAADGSRVHGRPVQPRVDGAEQLRRAARARACRSSRARERPARGQGRDRGRRRADARRHDRQRPRHRGAVRARGRARGRGRPPARLRRGDRRDDPRRGRRGGGARAPTRRARPTAPRSWPSA